MCNKVPNTWAILRCLYPGHQQGAELEIEHRTGKLVSHIILGYQYHKLLLNGLCHHTNLSILLSYPIPPPNELLCMEDLSLLRYLSWYMKIVVFETSLLSSIFALDISQSVPDSSKVPTQYMIATYCSFLLTHVLWGELSCASPARSFRALLMSSTPWCPPHWLSKG